MERIYTLRRIEHKYNKKLKGGIGMNEREIRKQAREAIIERLKEGYNGYYSDLHQEIFNTDYYIIGTERAKQALTEYGIFEAIKKVQEYEKK